MVSCTELVALTSLPPSTSLSQDLGTWAPVPLSDPLLLLKGLPRSSVWDLFFVPWGPPSLCTPALLHLPPSTCHFLIPCYWRNTTLDVGQQQSNDNQQSTNDTGCRDMPGAVPPDCAPKRKGRCSCSCSLCSWLLE